MIEMGISELYPFNSYHFKEILDLSCSQVDDMHIIEIVNPFDATYFYEEADVPIKFVMNRVTTPLSARPIDGLRISFFNGDGNVID